MSTSELKEFFNSRIDSCQSKIELLDKKHRTLSLLRIVLFISLSILIVYAANDRNSVLLAASILAFIVGFGVLIRTHNRIKFERQNTKFRRQLNQEEIQRLEGDFANIYSGEKYDDKSHFYTSDLDIFGSSSIYQLLVRSRISPSRNLAAQWLKNHADPEEITKRQEAVAELIPRNDWREQFTSLGMHIPSDDDVDQSISNEFHEWIAKPLEKFARPVWSVISILMTSLGIAASLGILFFSLPYQLIFIPMLINFYLLRVTFQPLLDATNGFNTISNQLKFYERLIQLVEEQDFKSEKAKHLQQRLVSENVTASATIKSLKSVLQQLLNRGNQFYFVFNVVFLLDLFWLLRVEKWKRIYGSHLQDWFDVIHEMDVLIDMASLSFANPDFVVPRIEESKLSLDAKSLGHPMIDRQQRVSNDFSISDQGKIGLITGSNMSGKSTFQRTVGISLVMAQMGLPVCATEYTFSTCRVFTSMRTQDNLEEHISSFYAELSRLKLLLDSFGSDPIFFLLDEILKGTNSEDRHTGSVALIDQLSSKNGMGLVSTHDLSLSEIDIKNVQNYSFNSTIVNDEIIFDYKLTHGPCKSFNASKMMENMGIILRKK